MSTLAITHPTLLDVAKRTDPDGKISTIVEILNMQNEILSDMVWLEANGPTSHRTTIRSGLPTPTWKKLNYGIQPTKSRTLQITDTLGHLADIAEVDADLAELNGNSAEFMLSEHLAHIEGMNQEFTSTLFYGNEGEEPAEFTGLSPRFNDQTAESGTNVLTDAATPDGSDNTSIWLIGWGPNTVHGIYPKGSTAGLTTQDDGKVMSENQGATGLKGRVYRTTYDWKCGLTVRDWRYVVRMYFDLENVKASGATGPVLYDMMAEAMHRIPSLGMCRPAFYCNRDVLSLLDRQQMNKGSLGLTNMLDTQGKPVQSFRGVPVRRCDSILSTEAFSI